MEIQPERVLHKRNEEKSTERVGLHVQDLASKLTRIRTAITNRLSGFEGFNTPASSTSKEESYQSVSFRLAEEGVRDILVEGDQSISLFVESRPPLSPTPPPDSPNLSSVSPPSYPEDWTLSFLSASHLPSPQSSLLLPHPPSYHGIRVARNSGDEDQSLEPVSLSPLDQQGGQIDAGQTAIRSSTRRWWRVLLCRCWKRKETR